MEGLIGIILFVVLTAILWWALQRQLDTGAQAHHGHEQPALKQAAETKTAPKAKAAPKAKTAPRKAAPKAKDDLTRIEGIGPAISKHLAKHGISTYAELGAATQKNLNAILDQGGRGVNSADPGSWPKQAKLAAKGDWKALEKLQKELLGGR